MPHRGAHHPAKTIEISIHSFWERVSMGWTSKTPTGRLVEESGGLDSFCWICTCFTLGTLACYRLGVFPTTVPCCHLSPTKTPSVFPTVVDSALRTRGGLRVAHAADRAGFVAGVFHFWRCEARIRTPDTGRRTRPRGRWCW